MFSERDLMISLKVISQLKTHEKISSQDAGIRIESHGNLQSLRRWWHGENRTHNIDTVETILDCAFAKLRLRLQKVRPPSVDDENFFKRLRSELGRTRVGVTNLQTTYQSCSLTHARLDCILEKIDNNLAIFPPLSPSPQPQMRGEEKGDEPPCEETTTSKSKKE